MLPAHGCTDQTTVTVEQKKTERLCVQPQSASCAPEELNTEKPAQLSIVLNAINLLSTIKCVQHSNNLTAINFECFLGSMSLPFKLRNLTNLTLLTKPRVTALWIAIFCFATGWVLLHIAKIPFDGIVARNTNESAIFFLETSGEKCLTRRQVCSIESTARTNPQSPINVIFVIDPPKGSPSKYDPGSGKIQFRDCSATSSLLNFPNVAFHRETFLSLLNGTLLQDWFLGGSLNQSNFPIFHTSDALRIAILKKHGGMYVDLDCLVVRPLNTIRNSVGMKHSRWIENGVLSFDAQHPFLSFYERAFIRNYGHAGYDANGPKLMTSALQRFCNTTHLFAHTYHCRDSTINVLPADSFYLVDFEHRNWFYSSHYPRTVEEVLKTKYLTHVYENDDGIHKAPPGTLYANLAKDFCPTAYQQSIQLAGFF